MLRAMRILGILSVVCGICFKNFNLLIIGHIWLVGSILFEQIIKSGK